MPAKRYTVVIANRSNGALRRLTFNLRPVLMMVVGVTVLHGVPQVPLERDRVIPMPAIAAIAAAGAFGTRDQRRAIHRIEDAGIDEQVSLEPAAAQDLEDLVTHRDDRVVEIDHDGPLR